MQKTLHSSHPSRSVSSPCRFKKKKKKNLTKLLRLMMINCVEDSQLGSYITSWDTAPHQQPLHEVLPNSRSVLCFLHNTSVSTKETWDRWRKQRNNLKCSLYSRRWRWTCSSSHWGNQRVEIKDVDPTVWATRKQEEVGEEETSRGNYAPISHTHMASWPYPASQSPLHHFLSCFPQWLCSDVTRQTRKRFSLLQLFHELNVSWLSV